MIFILLSLIFRSVSAGLLGIIPLSISVLVLFGLMGLTGIKLDVATALLSSVMIGVGVDYYHPLPMALQGGETAGSLAKGGCTYHP